MKIYFPMLVVLFLMTPLSPVLSQTITYADLMGSSSLQSPVDDSAFARPHDAEGALHRFQGRLKIDIASTTNSGMEVWHKYLPDDPFGNFHPLPGFDFEFIQDGSHLIPVRRGLISTTHPLWDYFIGPGRVWSNKNDRGYSRAAFPFALVSRSVKCAHNGVMTFLYNDQEVSQVQYQVTQETCHFWKFDLWGRLSASYHPQQIADAKMLKANYKQELANRLPVKPYADFAKDFPKANLEAFSEGQPLEHLSTQGIYYRGVHYTDHCGTRYGKYAFCDSMMLTSFSTAKTAFPGVALMALAQDYGLSVLEQKIGDYLPETKNSPGDWSQVTFNHVVDMSSGNYDMEIPMADRPPGNFYEDSTHDQKLASALSWPHKSTPGSVFVYQTADTYILVTALTEYLKSKQAPVTDIFNYVLEKVYRPAKLPPDALFSARTHENGQINNGMPIGGYGQWWTKDAIVKLAKLLLTDGGKIGGKQVLHPQVLSDTMQQNPKDRGVDMKFYGWWYNNAAWAYPVRRLEADLSCDAWVVAMSGVSGIRVLMMPNGLIYYYFNDSEQYPFAGAIREAHQVESFCP